MTTVTDPGFLDSSDSVGQMVRSTPPVAPGTRYGTPAPPPASSVNFLPTLMYSFLYAPRWVLHFSGIFFFPAALLPDPTVLRSCCAIATNS